MSRIKVLVTGPALTRSGYGVHARLVLESLKQREEMFDVFVNPLRWGATGWLLDESPLLSWIHKRIYTSRQFSCFLQLAFFGLCVQYFPSIADRAPSKQECVKSFWSEKFAARTHNLQKLQMSHQNNHILHGHLSATLAAGL